MLLLHLVTVTDRTLQYIQLPVSSKCCSYDIVKVCSCRTFAFRLSTRHDVLSGMLHLCFGEADFTPKRHELFITNETVCTLLHSPSHAVHPKIAECICLTSLTRQALIAQGTFQTEQATLWDGLTLIAPCCSSFKADPLSPDLKLGTPYLLSGGCWYFDLGIDNQWVGGMIPCNAAYSVT